ncbi:MAG: DUF1513 domain-containing protein [Deltaproteobacteria bacterium]|nr:DUF1513 domain-containing protein [Deltaproteobacteria bacterium]
MSEDSTRVGREGPSISRRAFLVGGALVGGGYLVGCRRDAEQPAPRSAEAPLAAAEAGGPAIEAVGPAQPALLTRHGMALGGGRGDDKTTGAPRYWLSVVDLDRGERVATIPTAFFPHGIAAHPQKPHVVMLFEKHGEGCCQVDLRAGRVTATVRTVAGNQFYGHGAYAPDAGHFYCTETAVDDEYRGLLMVRDSRSFEALGELPTGGKEPHDCVLIAGGRTLVVTNGGGHVDNGGEASVTYVDVGTRAVQHTLRFSDPTLNAGHLWLTSKGELAVVSAPRSGLDTSDPKVHGAISFFSPGMDRGLRTVTDPILAQMRGETLSVAVHEPTMVVGATNPDGDLLTFWDFHTGKLLRAYHDLKGPRGIGLSLDRRYFAVTYGPQAALVLIDTRSLDRVAEGEVAQAWMTGSHVVCHDWS